MKKWFRYIIVPIVGFFFLLSACEISTSYFSNTFDDDYDVYVQPDNSHLADVAIDFLADDIQFETILLPAPVDTYILFAQTGQTQETRGLQPPLYLSNRILLI
ncbi:MAG: hypothetical protein Q8928_15025 [Bacteroidota bacterium]|nr:hypothetical protein [Bacteroidota bacterium]